MEGLQLTFDAELPKSKRAGGSGREGEPWEQHLAPLKGVVDDKGNPKGARIFTFEDKTSDSGKVIKAKAQAATKVALIGGRLRRVAPTEEWKFNIRPLTDEELTYGLWVTYVRTMNDDEYKAYVARRDERSQKIQATRKTNAAASAASASASAASASADEATNPPLSPAEKVKQAREKVAAS